MDKRIVKTKYRVDDMDGTSMVIYTGCGDDEVGTSARIYCKVTDGVTTVYETGFGWFIVNNGWVYDCDCNSPSEAVECAEAFTQHLRFLSSIEKDMYHLC